MFEDLVGILYGFAVLSDQFVVFLGAELSLDCGTFSLAHIVEVC